MIARRPHFLHAVAPLTVALALLAGSLAQPAMARSKPIEPAAIDAALAKGDGEKGIALAEASVEQSPRVAASRATLGRAYLKNGRFQSATTALSDAITLGDNSGRTLLALALAQIGNGQNDAALRTLDMGNSVIPVADLGLALALAGEGDKGSLLLGDALRAGDKSDKLRANLGYAYALAGRWAEARTIVSMDLPADKVDDRMAEWAQAARPEASRQRVAKLLGVGLVDDAGLPMQLALNKSESPVQMAAAEPAPMAAPAVAAAAAPESEAAPAPTELPAMGEPVAQPAPVYAPAPVFHAIPMPMTAPMSAPMSEPVARPAKMAMHKAAAKPKAAVALSAEPAPVVKLKDAVKVKVAKAEPRVASGSHVLQLGAFLSEKNALRAKKAFLARETSLADADVAITKATVEDRQFWRVSVSGYNASAASSKCTTIRKGGGACFAHVDHVPAPAGVKVQGKALAMATPKR